MRKLYRSRRNKKILGLCGGISEMLNVDVTLIRILLVIITVLSSGTAIFIYIIAGLVVPKEPPIYGAYGPGGYGNNYGGGFGGGGYNGGFGSNNGPFNGPHNGPHNGPQTGYNGSYNSYQQRHKDSWDPNFGKQEPAADQQFDSMMDDLEKKALRREIEELKAKIAKQEKGE